MADPKPTTAERFAKEGEKQGQELAKQPPLRRAVEGPPRALYTFLKAIGAVK